MLVWSCSLANSTLVLEHESTLHQQVQVVFFYSLFGVVSDEIWGMIKIKALYHLPGYKTLELVVISEPIFSSDNYDPTNNGRGNNPLPSSRAATISYSSTKFECECGCG
jgi:hypothetical protein